MTGDTRVICLGNEMVRDDGIGVRVGRVLQRLPLPEQITVELRRMVGLELLDELRPDQALLLVDATQTGAEPGSISVLEFAEATDMAQAPYCCHGVGLAEVLVIARRLHPERLPSRATVVGIEAEELESFGTSLTATLQAALPEAVATVLAALKLSEELQRQGREEGTKWQAWEPSIAQVAG
jgi:hydrogenase maturation protease